MKKLPFLLIPLGIVFIIIYSLGWMTPELNKKSEKGSLTSGVERQEIKIAMNTERPDYDIGVNEIELEIVNSGKIEIGFGEYYTVEKLINGTWYEIPFKDNVGFDDILHILEPNKNYKEKINTGLMRYTFKEGKYRITKEFYSDGDKIELAAEFSIKLVGRIIKNI